MKRIIVALPAVLLIALFIVLQARKPNTKPSPVANMATQLLTNPTFPGATIKRTKNEVQIDVGETGAWPNRPLEELSLVTKKDRRSQKIRVSWSFMAGSHSSKATSVYDRKAKTIKYQWRGSDGNGVIDKHYLFTKVTDAIIHKYAADHPENRSLDVLEGLSNYGCTFIDLHRLNENGK